tara:strand:+ start:3324 stop:3668 length:345 start_codon:yes stop_codon:yes gene_type:complete
MNTDQDWKTVIIHGKSTNSKTDTEIKKKQTGTFIKDIDIHETGVESKVSSELKKKLTEIRVLKGKQSDISKLAGQSGKKLSVKEIQDLEAGKCTEKQAKQIALIYQKIFHCKLL